MQLPEAVTQVAAGIYQVQIPLPFALRCSGTGRCVPGCRSGPVPEIQEWPPCQFLLRVQWFLTAETDRGLPARPARIRAHRSVGEGRLAPRTSEPAPHCRPEILLRPLAGIRRSVRTRLAEPLDQTGLLAVANRSSPRPRPVVCTWSSRPGILPETGPLDPALFFNN